MKAKLQLIWFLF